MLVLLWFVEKRGLGWIDFKFCIYVDEVKEADICLLLPEELVHFGQ